MVKLVREKNNTVVVSSAEFNSISGQAQDFLNGNEKAV